MTPVDIQPATDKELVLQFLMDASPEALFRCWTEAELMTQWFAPKPWTTAVHEIDVRVGGGNRITMRGPGGEESPAGGVYLDVQPARKLVFTDAFSPGWVPAGKPFMVGELTFEPKDGKTLYTARVRHWHVEDRETHAQMGFKPGWTQCAQQLEDLAKTL